MTMFRLLDVFALANCWMRRYDVAVDAARRALRVRRGFIFARVVLAAALAHDGAVEEARTEVDDLLRRLPSFSIQDFAHMPLQPGLRQTLTEGLEKAGLET